jgi:hypothetical protein
MIQDEKGQTGHTDKHPLVFSKISAQTFPGYAVCACWLQKIGYARMRGCNTVWYEGWVNLFGWAWCGLYDAVRVRRRPPQVAAGENPLSGATDYSRGREYAGAGA